MYHSKITGIGPEALDFLEERLLILFHDNAPQELADISVLHKVEKISGQIEPGCKICIGNQAYVVTAVGKEANRTFETMGHCTLKFNGLKETQLPGDVELLGDQLPSIGIGDELIIRGADK